MLTRLHATPETLPQGLLEVRARDLHTVLPGPTLIHLEGRRQPELFVSVLLHGNEDTGLVAIQQVLRNHLQAHRGQPLPRAMSLFIGNVRAAREGLRRLDEQPDYNRVWPGAPLYLDTPEHALMKAVRAIMIGRGLFASIDIHNNTGLNPHYGVVCRLDAPTLHLATLFNRTVVWFRGPPGSQTAAFAELCPAIAVECGKPGHAASEEAAARFVEACLHLNAFPAQAVREADIDLYHTMALVKVAEGVDFAFGDARAQLDMDPRLDHLNFVELKAGAVFGRTTLPMPLDVRDEAGQDVSRAFFDTPDGLLRLARPAMPAMLTLDARVIRQDCLCYLMERVPFELVRAAHPDPASPAQR